MHFHRPSPTSAPASPAEPAPPRSPKSRPRTLALLTVTLFSVALALVPLLQVQSITSDALPSALQHHARPPHTRHTPPRGLEIPCETVPTRRLLPPPPPHPFVHERLHASLFRDYAPWHAEQRRCLLRNPNSTSCAPLLVWTCPPTQCAGTGDRMRGILFTYMLAVASRRVFLIDWSTPAALSAAFHPAAVDWTLPPHLAALRKGGKAHTMIDLPRLAWFRCLNKGDRRCQSPYSPSVSALPARVLNANYTLSQVGTKSINLLTEDIAAHVAGTHVLAIETRLLPHISYFLENPHLRRALIGNDTDQKDVSAITRESVLRRQISHALFRSSPGLENALAPRLKRLGDSFDAVHARLGGDLGEKYWSRFKAFNINRDNTADELLNCLDTVRKQTGVGGSVERVYLATDTHEFKSIFAAAGKKRGVEVVWHSKPAVHIKEGQPGCDDYRDIFADIWLLGQAQVLLGSRSGFSDLADRVGVAQVYGQLRPNGLDMTCEITASYIAKGPA